MLALALPSSAFWNTEYICFSLIDYRSVAAGPFPLSWHKGKQKPRLRALLAKNTNNRRCQKNSLFRAQTVFGLKYWKYSCFLNAKLPHAEALDPDLSAQFKIDFKDFKHRPFLTEKVAW